MKVEFFWVATLQTLANKKKIQQSTAAKICDQDKQLQKVHDKIVKSIQTFKNSTNRKYLNFDVYMHVVLKIVGIKHLRK